MDLHDEHSDVYQWGINLLNDDPRYCVECYGNTFQYDHTSSDDDYNGHMNFHSHYDTERNQVENDEIIARTLQEEFSHLEIAERSRYSHEVEDVQSDSHDYTHEGVLEDRGLQHGDEYTHRGVDASGPTCSCCSPSDAREYSLELIENYPLDDEIGRRLSQMVPFPHVPKINGEIPSIDEATSDHQRLLDRLQLYDFMEHQVLGDGNCQFRALSDQLYNTPDLHEFVRQQVVNQLKSRPEIYKGYVPMKYGDYLEKISKSGEWGDHVTLQAAADSYCVRIFVMTSFKDTFCIEILPHLEKPKKVIFLSFWAEVHYNSIYPRGGVSTQFSS